MEIKNEKQKKYDHIITKKMTIIFIYLCVVTFTFA